MKKALISDCEGPISKNDNAFEVTSNFVPNGDKLFTVISRYDDVLADIFRKPGYNAGDTLKLIIPFLKAYDLTDQKLHEFSAQNLVLIKNVKYMLQHVREIAHVFIVSTSYEHYMEALSRALEFPHENTYCTKVSMDEYCITEEEKNRLKELASEISQMPVIEIPSKARSLNDLPERHRKTVQRLDDIFWKEMADMESGRIFKEVNPVGGTEKAGAVRDAAERVNVDLADIMYVGDSITDVEPLKLAKESDGLAVSFNGNRYAIKNAEIAVLSKSSIVTGVIADVFCRLGKHETMRLVRKWNSETLGNSSISQILLDRLSGLYRGRLPKVKIITSENMESLAEESSRFRKTVRGEAIGRLG